MIQLLEGDCLELMKNIKDKSVDMILCDLPYGTTACEWDSIINLEELWQQYERILKISGNIILTASQPFTSKLIMSKSNWFSHSWIWQKEQGVNFLCSKNQPLKIHEDVLVFRKPDSYSVDCFIGLRKYFKNIFDGIGVSKKEIIEKIGQGVDHCFRFNSNQWALPTEKNYLNLRNTYNLDLIPYNTLKKQYKNEFFRIYNPQKTKGKPYTSGKGDSGEVTGGVKKVQTKNSGERLPTTILKFNRETGLHPTQKPIKLFEYLIKTYTNKGDLVLDNCAGSGTTGVACKNLNRECILIEQDREYCNVIRERLSEERNIKLDRFIKEGV